MNIGQTLDSLIFATRYITTELPFLVRNFMSESKLF